MNKHVLTAILTAIVAITGMFVVQQVKQEATGGVASLRACTVYSTGPVTVGHQQSSTLLGAYSNRAWAVISTGDNATNTVYVAFATSTAATASNGYPLNAANTGGATSTKQEVRFGLNTEFPYTGAVTGLTDNGSTTVYVTDCRY